MFDMPDLPAHPAAMQIPAHHDRFRDHSGQLAARV
jgi:hypothetical protein